MSELLIHYEIKPWAGMAVVMSATITLQFSRAFEFCGSVERIANVQERTKEALRSDIEKEFYGEVRELASKLPALLNAVSYGHPYGEAQYKEAMEIISRLASYSPTANPETSSISTNSA